MQTKEERVRLKCDNCNKVSAWKTYNDATTVLMFNGWIQGYYQGSTHTRDSRTADYCSVKCLHEAIDKEFSTEGGSVDPLSE